MRSKRKLFRKELLIQLAKEHLMGVPVARLIRDNNLDCSDPHLAKHLDYYNMFKNNKQVIDALFPPWLTDEENIQEEPEEYKFKGLFPWGEWVSR